MFDMQIRLNLKAFTAPYERAVRKWLGHIGGFTRKVARRSLRQARRKREDELTEDEFDRRVILTLINLDNGQPPPPFPDRVSEPGSPPLLHGKRSPLKYLLNYAVDEAAQDVVIGPERARSAIANRLEFGHGRQRPRPFMGPAERHTRGMMADAWRGAFN
jgi:hypothetical protein